MNFIQKVFPFLLLMIGMWIHPLLGLAVFFFWVLYRPDLIPMMGTIAVGLVYDQFFMMPLGLSSFIFFIGYVFLFFLKKYLAPVNFRVVWMMFVPWIFFIFSLELILYYFITGLHINIPILEFCVIILAYPWVSRGFYVLKERV